MVAVLVQRRGRGAAIKLPAEFLEELQLKNGDLVELKVKDGKAFIEPARSVPVEAGPRSSG